MREAAELPLGGLLPCPDDVIVVPAAPRQSAGVQRKLGSNFGVILRTVFRTALGTFVQFGGRGPNPVFRPARARGGLARRGAEGWSRGAGAVPLSRKQPICCFRRRERAEKDENGGPN